MAIREVREMGDDVLEKQCKPVTKMTLRTKILIEDMLDTMYEKMGVAKQRETVANVSLAVASNPSIIMMLRSFRKLLFLLGVLACFVHLHFSLIRKM